MTSSEALLSDSRHRDGQAWTPQLWAILIVLGGALCLAALDVSMIGVALPSIRTALGLDHPAPEVDLQRLRAGLGRSAAAGRPGSGPARPQAGVPGRAGRLRARLGAGRGGQRPPGC